jgi:hypothetical protein
MIPTHTNVLQFATGATNAFAPGLGLDPTRIEAVEAYRRAKSYRENAMWIGLAVGGALGASLILLRRPGRLL